MFAQTGVVHVEGTHLVQELLTSVVLEFAPVAAIQFVKEIPTLVFPENVNVVLMKFVAHLV